MEKERFQESRPVLIVRNTRRRNFNLPAFINIVTIVWTFISRDVRFIVDPILFSGIVNEHRITLDASTAIFICEVNAFARGGVAMRTCRLIEQGVPCRKQRNEGVNMHVLGLGTKIQRFLNLAISD